MPIGKGQAPGIETGRGATGAGTAGMAGMAGLVAGFLGAVFLFAAGFFLAVFWRAGFDLPASFCLLLTVFFRAACFFAGFLFFALAIELSPFKIEKAPRPERGESNHSRRIARLPAAAFLRELPRVPQQS